MITDNDYDWTFANSDTWDYTHVYHDYPAKMIPQIPRKLFEVLDIKSGTLFDPYCGTGTTLVEALLRGLNAVGTDINPLARLIAQAKTDYSIDPIELRKAIDDFRVWSINPVGTPKIPKVKNLTYWFKEGVIKSLGLIRAYIDSIQDEGIKRFFQVAFSETVRESSNTRKDEFKLYRMSEEKLKKHNPNPFIIMINKLERNYQGYVQFHKAIMDKKIYPKAFIYDFNTVYGIPYDIIPRESIDIVITSPPYGDSRTTVAYGQFSRLSLEWLGISNIDVDKMSMGGTVRSVIPKFNCEPLDSVIEKIKVKNVKRAKEVASYYYDLKLSISNVSTVIKRNGYAVYVIANRKVASELLPTDEAVRCFFEQNGFEHINTYVRDIPNKRMPLRNSPSNIPGKTENTMLKEYIIIMKKSSF